MLIVSPRAFSRAAIRSACGSSSSIMVWRSSCRHTTGQVGRPVQAGRRYREDLVAGCGYPDRMLELRRQRAVLGDGSPAVAENFDLVPAGVDHWLDREEHAFAERWSISGPAVMQDRGGVVKDPPDPVTTEVASHRITVALGIALDRVADRAEVDAGSHYGNATHHRLVGDVDQPSRLQWDALADKEHPARIAVPAVADHDEVEAEGF